jgi:EAL domain-containing protein (putative c-di-GMP-specific phosphodiesterase class I)
VWHARGFRFGVSVNVSMRNLLDNTVTDHVAALIERHRIDPSALTLEVTESQLMADPSRTLPLLHRLDTLGVQLSIDDFGTGYSSLAYLKQLPVSEIKIDRSFIQQVTRSPQDVAIVRAVIDLAGNFNMTVVAEGVEDHATYQLMQELGCQRLQGYHISRPMPGADLPGWITRNQAEWSHQVQFGGRAPLPAPPYRINMPR